MLRGALCASNGRRAAARERASGQKLRRSSRWSSRLASSRLVVLTKRGNEDAAVAAADVATGNGLPTSPRARNSVTVRAVDIADAYSMSDGSSFGGEV